MQRSLRAALFLLFGLLYAACGGGGSGSGGGGTGFSVSPSSVAFTAPQNGTLPGSKSVGISFTTKDAAYVGAQFNGAAPQWLYTPELSGSGQSWNLIFRVNTTNLTPGTYTASIKVGIAKSDQSILATQDISLSYTVTAVLGVDSPIKVFSYVQGGAAPAAQSVAISGLGAAWQATTSQPWIKLGATSGTAPSTLSVVVDPAGLEPGIHTGTISLAHTGATDATTVSVQFTVSTQSLDASTSSLVWTAVNGTALAPQPLGMSLNSGNIATWTAVAGHPWVKLSKAAGSTPDSLSVVVDPAVGPLASGTHESSITLSAVYQGVTYTRTVPVYLNLSRPTLSLLPAALVLGGSNGRDFSARDIQVSVNTGTNAFPWTALPGQSWMSPSALSGTASATPGALTVTPLPSGLAGGSYDSHLDVSVTVNGDTLSGSIPVRLNLEAHRLLASDNGVAFASMPGLSKLTRTLHVRDSLNLSTGWTAVSNQAWLTATPSGTAGGDLVLTADPAGLPVDQISYATVTLGSSDTTVEGTERIQVGLWVGSADPAPIMTSNTAYKDLAMDPVRPYLYLASGGSSVDVVNVFTGTKVTTLPALGANIRHLTVSNDGSRLFVSDATNYRIVPVDLPSGTPGTSWPVGLAVGPHVAYARSNGQSLIVAGTGAVFNADTGTLLSNFAPNMTSSYVVSASLQGNFLSLSSSVRSLDYSLLDGGKAIVGEGRWPNASAWNSADYAFNADGSKFYAAFASPYDFYVFDTAGTNASMPLVQTLPGNAYPVNVEVAKDGRIFCMSSSGTPNDFWIYNKDGVNLRMGKVAGFGSLMDAAMKVSGDGLRMAILLDDYYQKSTLQIITVAP